MDHGYSNVAKWRAKWGEKVGLASVALALMSWGVEIFDKWSLIARLTLAGWIALALMHTAVLILMIVVYAETPKGAPARFRVLLATAFAIISWTMNLSLIGKIGGH
jgi:hypothetical protein